MYLRSCPTTDSPRAFIPFSLAMFIPNPLAAPVNARAPAIPPSKPTANGAPILKIPGAVSGIASDIFSDAPLNPATAAVSPAIRVGRAIPLAPTTGSVRNCAPLNAPCTPFNPTFDAPVLPAAAAPARAAVAPSLPATPTPPVAINKFDGRVASSKRNRPASSNGPRISGISQPSRSDIGLSIFSNHSSAVPKKPGTLNPRRSSSRFWFSVLLSSPGGTPPNPCVPASSARATPCDRVRLMS